MPFFLTENCKESTLLLMNKNNLQRNQMIILIVLLVIISIANYMNYYAPKRVKVMEDFSELSDVEKQYYVSHHKYIKISDDATFDKNGDLIGQNLTKDDISKGDNYLKFAVTPEGKIARWNKKEISYYVIDPVNFYEPFVVKAVDTYNQLFNNYFKLVKTNSANKADILFTFKSKLDSNEKTKEQFMHGLTNTYYSDSDNSITMAKVTLVYKYPSNNTGYVSGEQMYKVILHELGHAIGISGHSDNENDIMYPTLAKSEEMLSQRDRVTIKMLYSNNSKVLNRQLKYARKAKIKEAKKYAKNSSSANETLALINLAQTYFENDQKEKALETYKKAITKDANNPSIYKSMGECYYFSKKYDIALKYFNKSYNLTKNNEDKIELLNMIGVTQAKQNEFESAYKSFKIAYSANKDNYEVLQNLIATCMKTNRKQEVLTIINEYLGKGNSIDKDTFMLKARAWAKS